MAMILIIITNRSRYLQPYLPDDSPSVTDVTLWRRAQTAKMVNSLNADLNSHGWRTTRLLSSAKELHQIGNALATEQQIFVTWSLLWDLSKVAEIDPLNAPILDKHEHWRTHHLDHISEYHRCSNLQRKKGGSVISNNAGG